VKDQKQNEKTNQKFQINLMIRKNGEFVGEEARQ
jgi:hypothetical protein